MCVCVCVCVFTCLPGCSVDISPDVISSIVMPETQHYYVYYSTVTLPREHIICMYLCVELGMDCSLASLREGEGEGKGGGGRGHVVTISTGYRTCSYLTR